MFTNGTTFNVATTAPLTGQVPGFATDPANFQVANIRYSQFSPNGVVYVSGQPFATSAYRFNADGTDVQEYALGYRGGNDASKRHQWRRPAGHHRYLVAGRHPAQTAFSNFEYDFTSRTTGYLQASYATTTGTNRNTYTTTTTVLASISQA